MQKALDKRYGALTLEPRKITFIDRIVADSRDVALNHTAGLSLPQQVMMTLFSLCELMDEKKDYQKACIGIVRKRVEATIEGLGIEVAAEPELFDCYYGLIDFEFWLRKYVGEDVVDLGEGERPSARHRLPAGRGPRHRAAERRRLRRARLVGARVVREPRRPRLRRHRPRRARGRARAIAQAYEADQGQVARRRSLAMARREAASCQTQNRSRTLSHDTSSELRRRRDRSRRSLGDSADG